MISHGCVINGTVVNSVLSPGVRVDVGAVVRDSIVMFDTVIRTGAVVDRAILDKEVIVGQGAIVGDGPDFDTPNKQEPGRLNTGITVVGKQSVVPRGTRLGRNVKIGEKVRSTDYAARTVRSGGTVERATKRGAKVSLVFRGHGVAIVAPTGPAYGVVRIRVQGITVATVNLAKLPKSDARVIWSRTWHGDRKHRVGLVVGRLTGGRHVDLDAFLVLRWGPIRTDVLRQGAGSHRSVGPIGPRRPIPLAHSLRARPVRRSPKSGSCTRQRE